MSTKTIHVGRDVRAELQRRAAELRSTFAGRGTLVVNVVSSPGAGKTSLLQATARWWGGRRRMAVLVGDLATDRDAQRLAPLCPVEQLTTGGACHLEIPLLERGLERLVSHQGVDLEGLEFLFVENVGNLVCPASHDLAEHLRVVLLSATEGDDKPGKYPKMFRTADALVITKIDLLPHVPFSVEAAAEDARRIRPDVEVLSVSPLTGEGVPEWCAYLEHRRRLLVGAPAVADGREEERPSDPVDAGLPR
ncbi:MAG: hydrogenase accessory protein HypB [Planctomycetota bacterium]|nr:MAG: hydrogenase accessory protein HypB [Planctomycetota bacterium]